MVVISGTYCETIFYIRLKGPNILAESIQSEIQHATMHCQLEQETRTSFNQMGHAYRSISVTRNI